MINQFIHKQFLESLPVVSLKGFILKTLFIFFSVSLITYFLQGSIVQFYKSQPYLNIIGAVYPTIIEHLFYIVFILALFYKFNLKILVKQLFYQKINRSLSLLLVFLAIIILVPLLIRISNGLQIHPVLKEAASNQVIGKLFNPLAFLLFTVYLFIRAFVEEFIFRFVIFRFLRRKGLLLSIIISALVFSLLHQFGIKGSINTFIFGIIIAFYYEYSNSFLRTVFLHLLNNLVFATPIISLIEYYLLKL